MQQYLKAKLTQNFRVMAIESSYFDGGTESYRGVYLLSSAAKVLTIKAQTEDNVALILRNKFDEVMSNTLTLPIGVNPLYISSDERRGFTKKLVIVDSDTNEILYQSTDSYLFARELT